MIVVGDGDIIKNQFHISKGYVLPLGFDQFTRQTFGNKDFILNSINYLSDESGLISVRSRELKLRLLDSTKTNKQRLFWQLLNTIMPILLILGFGIIKNRLRKRKFSRGVQNAH